MTSVYTAVCGEASPPRNPGTARTFHPATFGRHRNVNLQFQDVARKFQKHLDQRIYDLLEIAAYVYAADCHVRRGDGRTDAAPGEPWRRRTTFIVPVRDLRFWRRPTTLDALTAVLQFMTEDNYDFRFQKSTAKMNLQEYFDFGESESWPFTGIERVHLFSGGLDSLACAVDAAHSQGRLVLVTHRSQPSLDKKARDLFLELSKSVSVPMIHIPVWVNKEGSLAREYTQRSRSFLYAALAAAVAVSVKARGITFGENGVVSLNLPFADELLGSRSSRTTHPKTLALLSTFLSLVLDRKVDVDNPYEFMTRTEVVSRLAQRKASHLIKFTRSCSHGYMVSSSQWHCGTCSQCIDRRTALVAAGLQDEEDSSDYKKDVFAGQRLDFVERNTALDYARLASELHEMKEDAVATRYAMQIAAAIEPHGPNRTHAASQFVQMYKRHAASVHRVLTEQLQQHSAGLLDGSVSSDSMVAMLAKQLHLAPRWKRCAERIYDILAQALPKMCKGDQPRNEKVLQQRCEGILKGHEAKLDREFPSLKWAFAHVIPDFSQADANLVVEIKYLKPGISPSKATEQIAADIPKYTDNSLQAAFIVYDPERVVPDDDVLRSEVERRPDVLLRIIR